MNETSIDGQRDRLGARTAGGQAAGVRALHRDDPGIARGAIRPAGRGRRRRRRPPDAPRCSRTSVKPPVDAPTSRQTRPAGSTPNASSAPVSFWRPARDERQRRLHDSTASDACRRRSPGFRSSGPRRPSRPGPGRRGASACARVRRLGEPALDQELVERSRPRAADVPIPALSAVHAAGGAHLAIMPRADRTSGASGAIGSVRRAPARTRAGRESPGSGAERGQRLPHLGRDPRRRRAGSAGAGRPPSRGRRSGRPGMPMIAEPDLAVRRVRQSGPPRAPRARGCRTRRSRRSPRASPRGACPRAWSRISWRSSGLAKRALIRPTDQPSAASASATCRARARRSARSRRAGCRCPPGGPRLRPTGRISGVRSRQVEAGIARVVQRERVVLGERGPEQRPQLLLVLRAGDDEVRELALGGQREHALVARAVLADEAGPVHRRSPPAGRSGRRRGRSGRRRAGGTWSRARRPAARRRGRGRSRASTACCSAIPTSMNRSGNSAWKRLRPVPVGMPAVIATIRRSSPAAISISSWPRSTAV